MNRDETVFVIGEEVARYNGAYKVSSDVLPFPGVQLTGTDHQGSVGQIWRGSSDRRMLNQSLRMGQEGIY